MIGPIKGDMAEWWFPDELLDELAGRDWNKPLNPEGTLYGMPIVYVEPESDDANRT